MIDYTTTAHVKSYGDVKTSTGNTTVDEFITGYSRAVDKYCNQVFGQKVYTNQRMGGVVDQDGLLTFYPAVPVMEVPTAASWRLATSETWQSMSPNRLDIEQNIFGCVVRLMGQNLRGYRGSRIRVQLSYTGGWTALDDIPEDFEMNMRRLVWWALKLREAPIAKTATMDFGQVVIPPSGWPKDIKAGFSHYVRHVLD